MFYVSQCIGSGRIMGVCVVSEPVCSFVGVAIGKGDTNGHLPFPPFRTLLSYLK